MVDFIGLDHHGVQSENPSMSESVNSIAPRRSIWKRVAIVIVGLLLVWLVTAYLFMPEFWLRYIRRHPSFDDVPRVTHTKDGIPGDPLNVSLTGTNAEVTTIMVAA